MAFLLVASALPVLKAQPTHLNPREYYVIFHNGHFLSHNDACTSIDLTGTTTFSMNTCVWEVVKANVWDIQITRFLVPVNLTTIQATSPTISRILMGNHGSTPTLVSLPVANDVLWQVVYKASNISDGSDVRINDENRSPNYIESSWTCPYQISDYAKFYAITIESAAVNGGSLAVDDYTFANPTSHTFTLSHTVPAAHVTRPYYHCAVAGTDYYYWEEDGGTAHYDLPPSMSSTPLTLDHFEWSLSGTAADRLTIGSSNTTSLSNSISCTSMPEGSAETATLTVRAVYTDGTTRSTTATITVDACTLPSLAATGSSLVLTAGGSATHLRYTTNGTDPSTATAVASPATIPYSGSAFTLRAMNDGGTCSSEWSIPALAAPSVHMECNNLVSITVPEGCSAYYTVDGTTPTTASTAYTAPFALPGSAASVTLKAIVAYPIGSGTLLSSATTQTLARHADAPVISVSGNSITISSPATVHYTTDGSTPTTSSPVYSIPIAFAAGSTVTVKALAVQSELQPSCVVEQTISPGTGTAADPYRIYNVSGLARLASEPTKAFRIEADIDASSYTAVVNNFSGSLESAAKSDGTFYAISNLSRPLMVTIDGGTVRNLLFRDVNIASFAGKAGAVAGTAQGAARIYNCGVISGSIGSNGNYCGSIVGELQGTARVVNCYSFASVTGGSTVAGIVGYNGYASTQFDLRTMVVNCMFYGTIDGGASRAIVYGGNKINNNNGDASVNNYNFYLDQPQLRNLTANCALPAEEEFLTRFEYFRALLNSNRELCAWYVSGSVADTALIAKWVLDPSAASCPVLKSWGRYPSVINRDGLQRWNESEGSYQLRTAAAPMEGKRLSTLSVTVRAGSHNSSAAAQILSLPVTDMDTLNHDFGYAKVQLPYYNELFGNRHATTHAARFGNNYTDQVVTGWKVTAVTGGTAGTFKASKDGGYNFADRYCTSKDLFATSGRVFAQGGYYYVPAEVTAITIEAYWGKAVYVCNEGRYRDQVNDASANFVPFGTVGESWNGQTVYDGLFNAQAGLAQSGTVYDQALVLVSNVQHANEISNKLCRDGNRPFTLMSVDLNWDNEPDYCLQLQLGGGANGYEMAQVNPIRFDFLAVPDLGLAAKRDGDSKRLAVGVPTLHGHFEITETAFAHFNEFRYDTYGNKTEAPLILNGGQFVEFITREDWDSTFAKNGGICDKTRYIIVGGNVRMRTLAEGTHNKAKVKTRHCPISVVGGEFDACYLSGNLSDLGPSLVYADNPCLYTNGGRFGVVGGAGQEAVNGDVTFRIDHSLIDEFYGGGSHATNVVSGNIDVQIDHSIVRYYCGGPKVGNMQSGKTVTTRATGTIFGRYYGAGNGGTAFSLEAELNADNDAATAMTGTNCDLTRGDCANWWLNNYYQPTAARSDLGFQARFRFEIWNIPSGTTQFAASRRYIYNAQFARTQTHDVSSTLDSCTVKGDFYGAGNLGSVEGNVASTLRNTTVEGSAYGGGYSASIPSFWIHLTSHVVFPRRDNATGVCYDGGPTDSLRYTWTNSEPTTPVASATGGDEAVNWLRTTESLTDLGTVSGSTTLRLEGDSRVQGDVFGGGNESRVNTDASIWVKDRTKVDGSVFGGGNRAAVGSNPSAVATRVFVQGASQVGKNIYGGGNVGKVNGHTQVEVGGHK